MKKQIQQARGLEPADLVLKNCKIIDVFCGGIIEADVALCGEKIAGIGSYVGKKEIDCKGSYVSPGFMEGHIHIESSMLSPQEFVKTVISHGTTTVVCDPHEIANVAGTSGVTYLLEASYGLPTKIYCMAPSCVPATHLENSGATLDSHDIATLLTHPRVIGLAEMMNFPGVLFQDNEVLEKIKVAQKMNLPIDGHAPGVTGKDLQAYIGSGIGSDHECTTAAEALEKLSSGMFVFIREGSTAKNLETIIPIITQKNSHRCLLVTDDCHPEELLQVGHLDRILRKAIRLGIDPVMAIQMVTINVANYYGIRGTGAVAPGYAADLVIFDDLQDIQVRKVLAAGKCVENEDPSSQLSGRNMKEKYPRVFDSVHVDMESLSFEIPAEGKIARVIQLVKDQLITECLELDMMIVNGVAVADCTRDIVKLAVVERHSASANVGLGFVKGTGLQRGALASSIGHDSHNITVLGVNDEDMKLAVQSVVDQGGGLTAVVDGRIVKSLQLEIAGLMSTSHVEEVAADFSDLLHAARQLGVQVDDPFMSMSFLALPVIPQLKMTDLGLVDVEKFEHVKLWV
jgi:adenine deaminase